jgi:DNA-binding NtrC family response regulator
MQATNEISPEGDSASATVLVAEDEVILRMMLSDHLRADNFHVLEAANSDEARRIMASVDGVDVLISDVHMTVEGEGLALARWMAWQHPGVPVILTSGSAGVQKSRAWESSRNVTDFVPKPYSQDVMELLVRARISRRDRSSRLRRHENARR